MKVEAASKRRSILGEGPHWDERSGTLLFDDAHAHEIVRYDPDTKTETEVIRLDEEVGNLIPYAEDNRKLLVCMGSGVYRLDMDTKKKTLLAEMLDTDSPVATRINDGKCDALGRLWAGTMPLKVDIEGMVHGKNNLWSFSKGQLKHKLDNISLSNGITWTADNRTMFYNDSVPGKTYAFDYDLASGEISNQRVLADFSVTPGYQQLGIPDGMTIDVNDKIWLTCFSAGLVVQIDPETAKVLNKIRFPAKSTTSCCFGGKNYDTLYVTSASFLPDASGPDDGLLYRVTELGVKGKPAFEFAG
uniref:SMP-30/Gluconolactonase/LRE-like region domain-containing protein n=1 Tax=Amblyomma maculatum TaxID=34609 RepID=G3MNN5_AMBMU